MTLSDSVLDYRLQDMQSRDLARVVAIERNAHVTPWGRISFEESLNHGHRCRCLWRGEQLLGYCVLQLVADELHILNVVVAPTVQGQGLGHVLLNDIFAIAAAENSTRIFLDVRESNLKAQSLYAKWGFELLSIRRQYYRTPHANQREDAFVYSRSLATRAPNQPPS